jgi:hypothetical protein
MRESLPERDRQQGQSSRIEGEPEENEPLLNNSPFLKATANLIRLRDTALSGTLPPEEKPTNFMAVDKLLPLESVYGLESAEEVRLHLEKYGVEHREALEDSRQYEKLRERVCEALKDISALDKDQHASELVAKAIQGVNALIELRKFETNFLFESALYRHPK